MGILLYKRLERNKDYCEVLTDAIAGNKSICILLIWELYSTNY